MGSPAIQARELASTTTAVAAFWPFDWLSWPSLGRSKARISLPRILALRPRAPAVGRLVDAAQFVLHPLLPCRCDVHDVRIGRMNDDAADGAGVSEAHVLKRLRVVYRLEDADAGVRAAEDVGLAGADPEDVGIRGRDRERAGARRRLLVEDGLLRLTEIVRCPHTAAAATGVEPARAAVIRDGHIRHAAADVGRADV